MRIDCCRTILSKSWVVQGTLSTSQFEPLTSDLSVLEPIDGAKHIQSWIAMIDYPRCPRDFVGSIYSLPPSLLSIAPNLFI